MTVKPREQNASRTELPKASRSTPASTDAIGSIPCEQMLVRLFTLLSLSLSTIRMIAVVTGMLIQEIKNEIMQKMLSVLDNAQLEQLSEVLDIAFFGVTVVSSDKMEEDSKMLGEVVIKSSLPKTIL